MNNTSVNHQTDAILWRTLAFTTILMALLSMNVKAEVPIWPMQHMHNHEHSVVAKMTETDTSDKWKISVYAEYDCAYGQACQHTKNLLWKNIITHDDNTMSRYSDGIISPNGDWLLLQKGMSYSEIDNKYTSLPILTVVGKDCIRHYNRDEMLISIEDVESRTSDNTWIDTKYHHISNPKVVQFIPYKGVPSAYIQTVVGRHIVPLKCFNK